MEPARRRRRDEETLPFQKTIAGNDLFDRVVEGEDPTLATVLADTLMLVGGRPEELTADQLGTVLPEVERRVRLLMHQEHAHSIITRLRRIVLGWEA